MRAESIIDEPGGEVDETLLDETLALTPRARLACLASRGHGSASRHDADHRSRRLPRRKLDGSSDSRDAAVVSPLSVSTVRLPSTRSIARTIAPTELNRLAGSCWSARSSTSDTDGGTSGRTRDTGGMFAAGGASPVSA